MVNVSMRGAENILVVHGTYHVESNDGSADLIVPTCQTVPHNTPGWSA